MFNSDAILEIPMGLIAIGMFAIYHFLQWYMVERMASLPMKKQEKPYEYVPECTEQENVGSEIINFDRYNADGSLNLNYYSSGEPVQTAVGEQSKPQHKEMSRIEGTETETLWNELQKAVRDDGDTPEPSIESQTVEEEIKRLQEQIDELSERAVQTDEDHLEEIIRCLHKKLELEGKYEQMLAIEEQYPEFFNKEKKFTEVEKQNVFPLHLKDINKKMDLPEIFEDFATHTVADSFIGKQRWFGTIVGKNHASYILFTDGTKEAWIYAGEKAQRLDIYQLVLIDVVRDVSHIELKNVVLLKQQDKPQRLQKAL